MANPSFSLNAIDLASAAIGRAAVFYAQTSSPSVPTYWDGTGDINLEHLGYTEGAITPTANGSFSTLTLPELMGEAPLKVYQQGEAPVLQFSVLCGTQALAKLFSPTYSGSAGYKRWRENSYITLALFPESLFIESNAEVAVAFTKGSPGSWTVGGNAATATQLAQIDLSIWCWKGYFTRVPPTFNPADGGKALQQVEFHLVQDLTKPDGHQLYTLGDPADASIDIDAGA